MISAQSVCRRPPRTAVPGADLRHSTNNIQVTGWVLEGTGVIIGLCYTDIWYDRYVFRPGLYLEVSVRWRNLWTLALNCLLVTLLILGLELACGLQEAALAVRGCVKQRIEVTY